MRRSREVFDLDFLGAVLPLLSPEILKRQIEAKLAPVRPSYKNCKNCGKKTKHVPHQEGLCFSCFRKQGA